APAPGRALARARTARRVGDLSDHQGTELPRRAHGPGGGAEREHCTAGRRPRVRARGRQGGALRSERRSPGARIGAPELPRLLMSSVEQTLGRTGEQLAAVRRRLGPRVPGSAVLLLLAYCVFLVIGSLRSTQFAQQVVSGIASGATFAALALALVLI